MVVTWPVDIAPLLVEDGQGLGLLIHHVVESWVRHWLRQVTLGLIASWRVDAFLLVGRDASAAETIRVTRYPVVGARPRQHLLLLTSEQL